VAASMYVFVDIVCSLERGQHIPEV